MCWRNASEEVSYPIREQDELLVQGYEKIRNNCLILESVDVLLLGHKHLSTRHRELKRSNNFPVLEDVVTQI